MPECRREDLREQLPLLATGGLSAIEATAVRAHLAECAVCSSDLAAIELSRRVLLAGTPRLDLGAITAAATAPPLTLVRGGKAPARRWASNGFLAAAASLLIIASLSFEVVRRTFLGPATGPDSVQTSSPGEPGGEGGSSGFSIAGGLGDLSTEDLSDLLDALDAVEGTVAAEPTSLRSAVVDTPEGR